MNDKLKSVSVETLNELQNWLESTKEFAIEQAPKLVEEILVAGFIEHSVKIVSFLAVASVMFFISKKVRSSKWYEDDINGMLGSGERGSPRTVVWIFGLLGYFISLVGIISNLYYMLIIYFTPRYYIVITIADLLKDK